MALHVQLVTPERLAFDEPADALVAPGIDGEIGVLPNHAPLVATLGPGELRLRSGENVRHVAIAGGFLEVRAGSQVAVFAEAAEFAENIDVERARLAAERAKTKLSEQNLTASELAQTELALHRALVRLRVGQQWRRLPTDAPR